MPFANYEELQATVAEWLARKDLQSNIIDFIRLAEIRIQQELELRFTMTKDTGTLLAQSFHTWPTDLVEPIDFVILTSPRRHIDIVNKATLEDIREQDTTNIPKAGYNRGLTIELAPTPGTHDYELIYWAGIPALTNTATTNSLLTNHPNLLLYGALMESAPFLGADERLGVWSSMFDRAIRDMKRKEARARMGGGPLRIRPDTFA